MVKKVRAWVRQLGYGDLGHMCWVRMAVDLGDKDWVESLERFGLMAIGFGR